MRCTVVAIGQRMPGWVQQAWKEYARRFSQGLSLELREVPAVSRSGKADITGVRATECAALRAAVPRSNRVVALDQDGQHYSTAELAQRLAAWMRDGRDVALLVGGPDGLTRECVESADESWSLGRLTLPHALVRVVIAEQLYRAWSLLRGHPYHRE